MPELKIDTSRQYLVDLAERVELFGSWYYPGTRIELRGDVLQRLIAEKPEVVKHADPA